MSSRKPKPRRVASEQKMFYLVLLSGVPVVPLFYYVFNDDSFSQITQFVIVIVSALWVAAVAANVKEDFIYHLRTLSNLVEAIRTEDYSMRSSRLSEPGELAELYQQIDSLTSKLKENRQEEFELKNLLERIVNQINVAIIACDSDGKIRMVNRLTTQLLQLSATELVGLDLEKTTLSVVLKDTGSRLVDHEFPGTAGRWQINVQHYRHEGKPGKIVFITDLKQVLSEEEISAWQRLIRVIAHEINNSLTPITSICQTLNKILSSHAELGNEDELRVGLAVIEERAKALKEFISVYARIAKLPDPQKINFQVEDLLQKVKRFFVDQPIVIEDTPGITLFGDPVHLEQLLINLIKNALEASQSQQEPVTISCEKGDGVFKFQVQDSGTGISNPANLFVPFYTTKAQGAGIGLTLCRQIAAKHGGQVVLENREDGQGALAQLIIPYTV
ncbi:MAG TPA: GHKL domain-containing protein [Pseudomonadales bacterium]|nr:GHKL domain-containing protein [Pseudomonadales bacterium]